MARIDEKDSLFMPDREKLGESDGRVSGHWREFMKTLVSRVSPMGIERTFDLTNNQSSAADITDMKFNKSLVSAAFVDYFIQRTTSSISLTERGTLYVGYDPSEKKFVLDHTSPNIRRIYFGDDNIVTANDEVIFPIPHGLSTGQMIKTYGFDGSAPTTATRYVIEGTGSLAHLRFHVATSRANALAGTKSSVSALQGTGTNLYLLQTFGAEITFSITDEGQVKYTSTNLPGTASISRIIWRAGTLKGGHKNYSVIG